MVVDSKSKIGFKAKLVKLKPTSPGKRFRIVLKDSSLTKEAPVKHLTENLHSKTGHNNQGRITSAHRIGRPRARYRLVQFKRYENEGILRVQSLARDPHRSARIALVENELTKKQSYILAHESIQTGDLLESGRDASVTPGNCLKIGDVPEGTSVFQLEFKIKKGAQCARSAGAGAIVLGVCKENTNYMRVRLPSKRERLFHRDCSCVIGAASNYLHRRTRFSKASHSLYFKGRRPFSRGIAKNPVDHPMGGRSNSKIGQSPSGICAKGYKTVRSKSRKTKLIKRS